VPRQPRSTRVKQPPRVPFTAARAKSANQQKYLDAIANKDIIFCSGHAGTGKTLLALSAALSLRNDPARGYERIVIIRPYIKSNMNEEIGALPGGLDEKVAPFLESIMDNLRQLCSKEEAERLIRSQDIEFTVLSMCRGRSFTNCIVIVEEAQNVPISGGAMKMLLTRIGRNAKLIIAGDTDQLDIEHRHSGFEDAIRRLQGLSEIAFVEMYEEADIQRNPIIAKILKRYSNGTSDSSRM
jgi:phosphate starvation-inducible PhoH-like protein